MAGSGGPSNLLLSLERFFSAAITAIMTQTPVATMLMQELNNEAVVKDGQQNAAELRV